MSGYYQLIAQWRNEEELLIGELRNTIPATQDMAHTMQGDRQERAADTIERLIRERDEARNAMVGTMRIYVDGEMVDDVVGERITAAEARGYRRGVQDAAKMLAEGPQKSGRPWPNPDKAILALLEQTEKTKLSDYSFADFEEQTGEKK